MANGRMVNCKIVHNPVIRDQMQSDTERLTFTWLITFADGYGRHLADPKVIRGLLFASREKEEHPTWEEIEEYLHRWEGCGLIQLYEAEGQRYLCFPKWRQNQPGLRMKERPIIPPPPGTNDETFPTSWYDEEKAAEPYDPEAPHMKLATEWYKRFTVATAKLVQPGPNDYIAAKKMLARCDASQVMEALDFYFDPSLSFWWARDKKDRRQYNFASFCTNIAVILADMSKPAPVTKQQREYKRQCSCGRVIVLTKQVNFEKCSCGKAWELERGVVVPAEEEEDEIDTDSPATADSAEQF